MNDLIYTAIYSQLIRLVPHLFTLNGGDAQTSKVSGYMDLHLDILDKTDEVMVIALSHYYTQNGDKVADPDMEIKVYRHGLAEALTYQDSYCYREVYPEAGKVNPSAQKALNRFLKQWLTNCINQGHQFKQPV